MILRRQTANEASPAKPGGTAVPPVGSVSGFLLRGTIRPT